MLTYRHAVRETAGVIAGAIDRSVKALYEKRVEQEPAMTDRMLGAIEESMHGKNIKGIKWEAKTLTDRGRGAHEKTYGADFMGVLNIDLPDFKVSKGFLAQAKLIKAKKYDLKELKSQCEKMLTLSPDSFVFFYHTNGIRVVPAIAVVGSKIDPYSLLYNHSAQRFFENHLECFIGDRTISSPTPDTLMTLLEKFNARSALLLTGKAGDGVDYAPDRETT